MGNAAYLLLTTSLLLMQSPPPGVTQLDIKGDFTEPLSRLKFPVQLLGWDRGAIQKYPDGHSVTYEFRQEGVTQARATIYLYPDAPPFPSDVQEHYAATLRELRALRPDLELMTEDEFAVTKGKNTIQMRMASMLYRSGFPPYAEPTIGFFMLSKVDAYWLKWRITVPASAPKAVGTERVTSLTSAFVPKTQKRLGGLGSALSNRALEPTAHPQEGWNALRLSASR